MGSFGSGGVDAYPADEHDLQTYRDAEEAIAKMQWPVLVHADKPHERLYIAALDGTGNNMRKESPEYWSVVAKIHDQIAIRNEAEGPAISSGYVPGIGTQDNFISRTRDGITGYTFEQRVETAYLDFCEKSYAWLKQDPEAQIRVAGIGFSRGAEEVAALHRVIEERGIRNPESADVRRNDDGIVTRVRYADKPLLREPGQTVQVAVLYDPVSTGVENIDQNLRSSVVASLQLTAKDEWRDQFRSATHIAPGCSDDRRFCNITVAGAHSDVGNTYSKNGLGARSFNLGVDLLNALSDRPFLHKQVVPTDPSQIVVHRSDQHLMGLYTTREYDRTHERGRHTKVGGDDCPRQGPVVEACDLRQPANAELSASVPFRAVPITPVPDRATASDAPSARMEDARVARPEATQASAQITFFPRTALDDYLDAHCAAAERGDTAACSALTREYAQTPQAQQMIQQGRDLYEAEQSRQLEEQGHQEREQGMLRDRQQEHQQQEPTRSRGRSM